MKIPLLLIATSLALLNSGCTMLSTTRYLAASGDYIKRNNDSGGYLDLTWARIGKGNNGTVHLGDYSAEIWSSDYYSKELSFGFILPIVPRLGSWSHITETKRWIRIKNTSSADIVINKISTKSNFDAVIDYSTSRYPGHSGKDDKLLLNQNISYSIHREEYIWICLPEEPVTEITLLLGNDAVTVKLEETCGLKWWMITV